MTTNGRSAWTTVGKDNGEIYYKFVKGEPLDGSTPEKGTAYECVRGGVVAIQQRLFDLGYESILKRPFDQEYFGQFNKQTRRMVKAFQENHLPPNFNTGLVGQTTAKHLFGRYLEEVNPRHADILFGFAMSESAFDPGAQGYTTPGDIGLFQINTVVHTDFDIERACDYQEATNWVSNRFNKAWSRYAGKGPELRLNCAIAQHNAPAWADQWFDTGEAPNEKIADYVERVKTFAIQYGTVVS